MTKNYEVLQKNPLLGALPNQGVAQVNPVAGEAALAALRFELESFVCEGAYLSSLDQILGAFVANIGKTQPAVWVSGFYGSGKSHLVKILSQLWSNEALPDGATPRGLVNLPQVVQDQLRELDAAGARAGGLWTAAGMVTMGNSSINEAFVTILLKAAGLPTDLQQAACVMWLEDEGILESVQAEIAGRNKVWQKILNGMFVSELAEAILKSKPHWAESVETARGQLVAQFERQSPHVTVAEVLGWTERILTRVSTTPGKLPCTLVVLDEIQQFIGESPGAAADVMGLVEACSNAFDGQLTIVGTGQSALMANPTLQRLIDRFPIQLQLLDQDVGRVVREVVLRKDPSKISEVESVLEANSGEVSRQLAGARIAPDSADQSSLVTDYPILPSRRRFIDKVLHGIDDSGRAAKLRTQLRLIHDAVVEVANQDLGYVIPADFIFSNQANDMVTTGAISREIFELIRAEESNADRGVLRSRILSLVFLISKLPRGGIAESGVRPNESHIADLLVDDLANSGATLRQQVPELLEALRTEGKLQRVDDEYQLQSKTGQEWTQAFHVRRKTVSDDLARIAQERGDRIRAALAAKVPSQCLQGVSKQSRKVGLYFGDVAPTSTDSVPVWCRTGWDLGEAELETAAEAAGPESPNVFVFIPEHDAQELKDAIVEAVASREVIQSRAKPTGAEGQEALRAMETIEVSALKRVDDLVTGIVERGRVIQGGGTPVTAGSLEARIESAIQKAVTRLYPKFGAADVLNWHLVLGKATSGNPDPLSPVGGSSDSKVINVLKEVKGRIKGNGTQGKEVIDSLTRGPFGWSKDTLHGAIASLAAQGEITVHVGGTPASVKDLKPNNMGTSTFKLEGEKIDLQTRMAVRGVLTAFGVPYVDNEEAGAGPQLVQAIKAAAAASGGQPPFPPAELPMLADEVSGLAGNDLLRAVSKRGPDLKICSERWKKLAEMRQPRLAEYEQARSLIDHAEPHGGDLSDKLAAAVNDRRALEDMDPFTALVQDATAHLRDRLKEGFSEYEAVMRAALARLDEEDGWRNLDTSSQQELLSKHDLLLHPSPNVASPSAILRSLSECSLQHWSDKTQSIETRVYKALLEAIQKSKPEARPVKLPSRTLETSADVDAYLDDVRATLDEALAAHSPVVVGG